MGEAAEEEDYVQKRAILWMIVVVAVVASAVWYAKQRETPGETTPGAVKIGVVLEMTGPLAHYAQSARRGMELASEALRPKLQLIFEDAQLDPKTGVSAFLKLRDVDKLQIMTGGIGSSTVMAIAPLANESRTLFFSSGATSPDISKAGDFIFRNRLSGTFEIGELGKIAFNNLKLQTMGILYVTTDYGTGYRDVFKKGFEKAGGYVEFTEGFVADTTDFRSVLTRAKESRVEGIFLAGHTVESATILRQARELGIKARFMSSGTIDSPKLWEIAGDAADGVIYSIQAFDANLNEKSRRFHITYAKKFGEEPELWAALGYDAVNLLYQLMKQHGQSGETVRQALVELPKYSGVMGDISFDENGDIRGPVSLKIASGGRFIRYERQAP